MGGVVIEWFVAHRDQCDAGGVRGCVYDMVMGVISTDAISHHFAEFPLKLADILRGHCKLDQIIEQGTIPLSKVAYPLG